MELWQESIRKIADINPEVMYFTHFGESGDIQDHLAELEQRLLEVTDWIGERLKQGQTEEEITPDFEDLYRTILQDDNAGSELIKSYELADPFWMNVSGLIRYWKKFRL